VPEPGPERPLAANQLDFTQASEQRATFEHNGGCKYGDRHPKLRQLFRLTEFVQAFVYGEQAAQRKQHQGDNKAPEVTEFSIAQRVLDVRWPLRLFQTEVQQDLVAGVRIAVNRFGEHAAGAGKPRSPTLGKCDAKIGHESVENCPGGGLM
jgi:hypothetical protein